MSTIDFRLVSSFYLNDLSVKEFWINNVLMWKSAPIHWLPSSPHWSQPPQDLPSIQFSLDLFGNYTAILSGFDIGGGGNVDIETISGKCTIPSGTVFSQYQFKVTGSSQWHHIPSTVSVDGVSTTVTIRKIGTTTDLENMLHFL